MAWMHGQANLPQLDRRPSAWGALKETMARFGGLVVCLSLTESRYRRAESWSVEFPG